MSKQDSNKCDICGEDALIHISDGKGGHEANYCQTCHNRLMAEEMGIEVPEDVPEELIITDFKDQVHRFKIEYMIWGHMQRLEAYEDYSLGYRCAVGAEFDVSFPELWDMMMKKLERKMNTEYIDEKGHWTYNKIVGDVVWDSEADDKRIIINGKAYTWYELYREVEASEGWQIKIEFADSTEDLD